MSDNFHKMAVLKKRKTCKLKLHRIVQTMGADPVPEFVQSLAIDFPDICPQLFLGNSCIIHVVAYPSRWPPKP